VRSRRTYGWRRIRAELADDYGQRVNKKLVRSNMAAQGISGPPARRKAKPSPAHRATTEDLVQRLFARNGPNQLWMTDITEHPTREGKLYCCVVLDAWSRRVVGWSLDRRPTAAMVNSALGMAIEARLPRAGTVIHCDHGTQASTSLGPQWRTRTELSTEIFDWIDVFYNRSRRHSGLGMLAPVAHEKVHADNISAA
jgi:putative transposase